MQEIDSKPISIEEALQTGLYHPHLDRWCDEKMNAELRRCSVSKVQKERAAGRGVPFSQSGGNIRYLVRDIFSYMLKNRQATV